MRKLMAVYAAAIVCSGFTMQASADSNLVQNGGFENGPLFDTPADWVGTGAYLDINPHSGNYDATFGAVGQLDFISQDLHTVVGQSYKLDFFLANEYFGSDSGPNEFQVSFGKTVVFDQIDIPTQNYVEYAVNVVASSTTTTLQFGGRHDPAFLYLDDVSVTPSGSGVLPELGSVLGLGGMISLGGLVLLHRRHKR